MSAGGARRNAPRRAHAKCVRWALGNGDKYIDPARVLPGKWKGVLPPLALHATAAAFCARWYGRLSHTLQRRQAAWHVYTEVGNCRSAGPGEQLLVGLGCRSSTALIAAAALLLQDGLFEKEFKRAYVGDGGAGAPMTAAPNWCRAVRVCLVGCV